MRLTYSNAFPEVDILSVDEPARGILRELRSFVLATHRVCLAPLATSERTKRLLNLFAEARESQVPEVACRAILGVSLAHMQDGPGLDPWATLRIESAIVRDAAEGRLS